MNSNLSMPNKRLNVRRIAVIGVLSSLTIVLNFTPLGFIRIPGLNAEITLMHLPVIIGAILEGPVAGAFIGLIFGSFSLYTATITPLPHAFAFLNPLVSVLPRILIGIVTHYVYRMLLGLLKQKNISLSVGIAAAAGTVTNTAGVLGMIYLFHARHFLDAIQMTDVPSYAVFALAFPNLPFELLAAIFLSIPVVLAIKKTRRGL